MNIINTTEVIDDSNYTDIKDTLDNFQIEELINKLTNDTIDRYNLMLKIKHRKSLEVKDQLNRLARLLELLWKDFPSKEKDKYKFDDWEWIGGDAFSHLVSEQYFDQALKKEQLHVSKFLQVQKEEGEEIKTPNSEVLCICGHEIIQNCWLRNKNNKEQIAILGNDCINFWVNPKLCERCGEIHRNRKDNFCKKCREIIKLEKEQEAIRLEKERIENEEKERKRKKEEKLKKQMELRQKEIEERQKELQLIEERKKLREEGKCVDCKKHSGDYYRCFYCNKKFKENKK